ncbi:MAG: Crp/Fnr family transcriptional regulator [Bifidobacteriaceae bacterium]|jgi:CRP-like cAMP-binding protein|nr:Crp/Fnr family transcriptional regulator [Bifidobacteriaceae bacterium]
MRNHPNEDPDLSIVTSSGLFAGISQEQAQRLRGAMVRVHLSRGDVLFREGEQADRLYIIESGKMKLGHTSSDNRENLLAVLGKGEIIGELTLFDPGTRTATATAVTGADLLELSHEALVEWLEVHPAASMHLLQALAQRLRRTNEAVGGLVFYDVPGRVAKALLDLAEQFGEEMPDGAILVQHSLTQEELAHLVGSSRETVNKALADYASRGWIRLNGRAVYILDRAHLAKRASQ